MGYVVWLSLCILIASSFWVILGFRFGRVSMHLMRTVRQIAGTSCKCLTEGKPAYTVVTCAARNDNSRASVN